MRRLAALVALVLAPGACPAQDSGRIFGTIIDETNAMTLPTAPVETGDSGAAGTSRILFVLAVLAAPAGCGGAPSSGDADEPAAESPAATAEPVAPAVERLAPTWSSAQEAAGEVHRETRLVVTDEEGKVLRLRLFGSMIERGGRWKLFCFLVDD